MSDKQIWKFKIDPQHAIEMPIGAEILNVQYQHDTALLWAIVDPGETRTEARHIEMFAAGRSMPPARRKYIGTIQIEGGRFVFHVFERVESRNER